MVQFVLPANENQQFKQCALVMCLMINSVLYYMGLLLYS